MFYFNISHQLFDYNITFVNIQLENTNSKKQRPFLGVNLKKTSKIKLDKMSVKTKNLKY